MLEIISGLMFGVGLAMFEWGLGQRNARLEAEKKVKRGRCRGYSGVTRPVPIVNDYEECLEDLMFETGMSEDELDEIMPDIGKDIEDWV